MALGRCNLVVQDDEGDKVDGASITVTNETTGSPGVPYSDVDGATPLGNPYVASDGASAGFYAIAGYYKVAAVKDALTRTLRHVPVGLAAGTDVSAQGETRTYTDADVSGGSIGIGATIGRAYINCTTPVNLDLPAAASRSGLDLELIDVGGNGFTPTNNESPVETINGGAMSGYAVTTPRGWLKLAPSAGGYVVIGAQF